MTTCANCGREDAADARFCSGCGAPLATDEATGEIRKVVTVVFTDLVDSTKLGERLDPETLRHVMSRYFAAMQATLERHGGTVEKFIGDAIMAVFGIPTLHEDDAVRAVRSAVEMRDELARLNKELEREHAVRLEIRIGVNTGQVVVGDSDAQQRLATGDAVNVAARLEQAARAGDILIGEETHRLVGGAVLSEPRDPLAVKGKSVPLRAWSIVELRQDVPAFTAPITAPFVGRSDELITLRAVFEQAARERTCALATIVGPPGIGKSRLARELIGAVADDARVVVGRCVSYGEGITYLPLAEIVGQVTGRGRGLAEVVAGDEDAAAVGARIAGAIGATDAAGSPEEIAWAFRRLFEALARDRPLVVVVDDIHWAEPTLLDLLEYVAGFSSGAPILMLCLARPDLFDARPSWAAPRRNATVVSLSPLSLAETERLIERLERDRELGERARSQILEAAEGNPLFVEQILALQADNPDEELAVPPTIQALLAARIDRLEPDERIVLTHASVEGRLFHRGALAELLPASARGAIGTHLLSLVRKEFVRPDRALFSGDDGFRFNHILIRDAAYESLPKQLRAELHGRYGHWLELRSDETVPEGDEILGYHFEQAYRLRSELGLKGDDTQAVALKAGRLLASAGRRASARGDAQAAVQLLERAVGMLAEDPRARVHILPGYVFALRDAGKLDAAKHVAHEAIELAREMGDQRSELRAEIQQARAVVVSSGSDDWREEARSTAERAIEVFDAPGDDGELADAWLLLGLVESLSGNGAAAVAAHRQAREHARAAGDDRREREIWDELGGAMLFSRTPLDEVLAFGDEELAWAKEKGFPFPEADGTLVGGYVYPMLGRFNEGRERIARAKAIFEELGVRYNLAEAYWAGGRLELLARDWCAAERELREALQIFEEMGAHRYVPMVKARLAHSLHEQERDTEALALIEEARAGAQEDSRSGAVWRTALAKVLAGRGETDEALGHARDALALLETSDRINDHADALSDLAEVLYAAGTDAEATIALEQALALYEEKGNRLRAEQTRAALASLAAASL